MVIGLALRQFNNKLGRSRLSPPMSSIVDLLTALNNHKTLKKLSLSQVLQFLTTTACLKHDINIVQPTKGLSDTAPEFLSISIQQFLSESVNVPLDCIPNAWSILKDYAWSILLLTDAIKRESVGFRQYGWDKGLSECFTPPSLYSF
jgi:hypothetical protein